MKKILVPIDGSAASKRAAAKAVEFAKCLGAAVTFLTVVDTNMVVSYTEYESNFSREYLEAKEKLHNQDREQAAKMLDAVAEFLSRDVTIEKRVISGEAHPTIVKVAEEEKIDMIIMGTRGLNPIQRFFAGSVAVKVLEDAPCPVLFVK